MTHHEYFGPETRLFLYSYNGTSWEKETDSTIGAMREENAEDPETMAALELLARGAFKVEIDLGAGGRTLLELTTCPPRVPDGAGLSERPPIGWDRWGRMSGRMDRAMARPSEDDVYRLLLSIPLRERPAAAERGAAWATERDRVDGGRWGSGRWHDLSVQLLGYRDALVTVLVDAAPADARSGS